MDNSGAGGSRSPFATLKNIVSLANRGTVSPRRFSLVSKYNAETETEIAILI